MIMGSDIDLFLLVKDVTNWYENLGQDYEDYHSPVFEVYVKIEFDESNAIISVGKPGECIIGIFPEELYQSARDKEILDYIIDRIYEIIK